MKQSILAGLVIFHLVYGILYSQQTEGIIYYELKVNVHKSLPSEMEHMKSQIPEFRTENKEMYFNKTASLMRETMDSQQPVMSGGMVIMRSGAGSQFHTDLLEKKKVEFRPFMDINYLVVGDLQEYRWNLHSDTKKIAGKMCQRATYTDTEKPISIEAWYSPEIPLPIGPDAYQGLPGAILILDVNNGEKIYSAVEIAKTKISSKMVQEPTDGKIVSEEEYRLEVEAKLKEMQGSSGGGNRTFRMIRN